jgi:hypothetical protein
VKLVAKRRKGMLLVEGGTERPSRTVDSLEHVRPMFEPVTEILGLRRAGLGHGRLRVEPVDEPANDQADEDLKPEGQRDVVEVERRRAKLFGTPPFGQETRGRTTTGTRAPPSFP